MSEFINRRIHRNRSLLVAASAFAALGVTGTLLAAQFGEWSTPVSAEIGSDPELNTAFNDGCPILSPDGLSLYMATNRPGGAGGLDIWVATRATTTSGWGAPAPLPGEINTPDNEFCPTPVRGRGLFFVRAPFPTMNGDIFRTRRDNDGWRTPERLPDTVNSAFQEWSPAYFEDEAGNEVLYFSTTREGGPQKIYFSVNFGPAQPVPELNAGGDAARPNVSKNGREIVFDSTRSPNLSAPGAPVTPDVWTATRGSTAEPWSAPQHLPAVSSPGVDSRASLSWDGTFLLVGSNRAGTETAPGVPLQPDIYVSTRTGRNGE